MSFTNFQKNQRKSFLGFTFPFLRCHKFNFLSTLRNVFLMALGAQTKGGEWNGMETNEVTSST